MQDTCNNCHKSCNRYRKGLCNTCYTKYRLHGDPNYSLAAFPKSFSEEKTNLITGSMLGDGHLRKNKAAHNTALYIKRAKKDYRYLLWEAQVLGNDILTPAGITVMNRLDARTNKIYKACAFGTRSLVALNSFYEQWYPDGTKHVPNDLQLNADIIAVWFCDDGCIKKTKTNRFYVGLATNSFAEAEVQLLQSLLSSRYAERVGMCRCGKEGQFILSLSDYAARKMIADIDPVFPNGMERKRTWVGIELPPVHYSHALSAQDRKNKVAQFIEFHKEFYLADLAKFLGWSFTRSDGTTEYDTQNAKRYLKEYVERGVLSGLPRTQGSGYSRGIKYVRIS